MIFGACITPAAALQSAIDESRCMRPSGSVLGISYWTPEDFDKLGALNGLGSQLYGIAARMFRMQNEGATKAFAEILDPVSWFTGVPS